MCGIAGIFTKNNYQDHLETLLKRMQTALQHRGSDDQGIYISSHRNIGLTHTRLSILDLSNAGHQPMSIENGRYWITFNGEIYNFRELRKDLEAQGETFVSQTDTEVILKLYHHKGKECVNFLRGMFAFAIWDNFKQTCFIARDPLGIKPLYYYYFNNTLIFASEIRAILATKIPKSDLDSEGLYGYFLTGTVPEPYTLIKEIKSLDAGHYLFLENDQLTKHQYWQIEFKSENISLSEAVEIVRNSLINSIEHHFISDVPVGIFLSGGIDSTSVVALSRQTQTGKLCTYSIAFEEDQWNEGDLAQKIAEKFETDHTEYKISASLGKQLFPLFLEKIDQPSIDGFNTFCVSQIAHQKGAKVVLSGLGGDELFGGYQSFQTVPKMVESGNKLKMVKPIVNNLGNILAQWGYNPRLKRLGDFLTQPPTTVAAYRSFRGIFSHTEAVKLTQFYLQNSDPITRNNFLNLPEQPSLEDEVSCLEISGYMRNQLLRDSDVMSMANSLELRVPLVDKILLENIASIPSNLRLAFGKKLLIQSIPELPDWVVNRPKRGFFFPFQQWLDGEWKEYFNNIKAEKIVDLNLWYRRWNLGILQYWLTKNN